MGKVAGSWGSGAEFLSLLIIGGGSGRGADRLMHFNAENFYNTRAGWRCCGGDEVCATPRVVIWQRRLGLVSFFLNEFWVRLPELGFG